MSASSPAAAGATRTAILPLRFEHVCFAAGGTSLLHDLDFEIGGQGLVVVLGPNGAGKSLTLRLAHGLITATSGRVAWAGAERLDAARYQAMVFAEAVLLRRSAADNVAYALALRGVAQAARMAIVQRVLLRTGLSALADRPARLLSSGEKQRLQLARAWALEPEVLFLDEPTGSLDPAATRQVEQVIEELAAEGRQIVMTTHDLALARRLARHVLFLHRGRLEESAPADRFFTNPSSDVARAYLAGELVW